MTTLLITDDAGDRPERTRKGEFRTHEGKPVPAGLRVALNTDPDGTDWYEVEIPDGETIDGETWFEWIEAVKVT